MLLIQPLALLQQRNALFLKLEFLDLAARRLGIIVYPKDIFRNFSMSACYAVFSIDVYLPK